MEKFCAYYQAKVDNSKAWILASCLRSTEHIAFDRTFDKQNGIFEFFVPRDTEHIFLQLMDYALKKELIFSLTKMENRLIENEI